MNQMASASGVNPDMLLGKRMTGRSVQFFIVETNRLRNVISQIVDPPTMIPEDPAFSMAVEMLLSSFSGVFKGSSNDK